MDSEKTNQIIQALLRDYINEQVAKDMNKPHISSVGSPIIMINPDSKEYRQYVKNTDQSIANAKNTPAPYRELTKLGQKLMQIERDFRYSTYPQHIKFVGGEKAPHSGPLPGAPDRRIQGEFSGEKNMQSEYEEILKKMAEKKVSPEMAIAAPSASPQYALPQVTPLTYGQPQIGRQPQGAMSNDPSDPVVPSVMTPAANKAEAFSDILNMMGQGQSQVTIPYQAGFRPPTQEQINKDTNLDIQRDKLKLQAARLGGGVGKVSGNKVSFSDVPIDVSQTQGTELGGELTAGAYEVPSAPSPWPGEGRQPQAVPETARNMDDILAALAINLVPAVAGNLLDPGAGYNPAIGTGLAGTQFLIKGRLDEEAAAREKEALNKKLAAEAEQNRAKMEYDFKLKQFEKEPSATKEYDRRMWYDPADKSYKWALIPKKLDPNKFSDADIIKTQVMVKPEEFADEKDKPVLSTHPISGLPVFVKRPTDMKPGEVRSIGGGSGKSTGAPSNGKSINVPPLNYKQVPIVKEQVNKFVAETEEARKAMTAAQTIKSLLNTKGGMSAIPRKLAQLVGDKGVLSNQDINQWQGSQALLDQIDQMREKIVAGKYTEVNQKLFNELVDIMYKKYSTEVNGRMSAYVDSTSELARANKDSVRAAFEPHVRFVEQGQEKPKTKEEKIKRIQELLNKAKN